MQLLRDPNQRKGGQPAKMVARNPSIRRGSRDENTPEADPGPALDPNTTTGFLNAEVAAARAALAELDAALAMVVSFKEKSLELVEEAHRAMSRLEQAVAAQAFPELIVLACEVKVCARRGVHLLKVYGRYRCMGKLLACSRREKILSKYDSTIVRMVNIMPGLMTPQRSCSPFGLIHRHASLNDDSSRQVSQQDNRLALSPRPSGAALSRPSSVVERAINSTGLGFNSSGGGSNSSSHGPVFKGVVIRETKHDRVYCISQPVAGKDDGVVSGCHSRGPSSSGGGGSGWPGRLRSPFASAKYVSIWWALGTSLEFYSGATQCTASFPVEKKGQCVACVAVDRAGNVWCGTTKGSLLVRQRHSWEQVVEERAFSSCVRCIEFDMESPMAWVGDEQGRLRVLHYDSSGGSLEVTATLLNGNAAGLRGFSAPGPVLGTKLSLKEAQLLRSCSTKATAKNPALEGPLRCMLVRDDRGWVAGGQRNPWICLFDAVTGAQLDIWKAGGVGACNTMNVLLNASALPVRTLRMSRGESIHGRGGGSGGGSSLLNGGMLVPPCVPEDKVGEAPRSAWKLLTGHENGQILIWDAAMDQLQPLAKVGEVGSPVKAIGVHHEYCLMSTAHSSGEVCIFLRPSEDMEWAAAPTSPHLGTLRPRKVIPVSGENLVGKEVQLARYICSLGQLKSAHGGTCNPESFKMGLDDSLR